MTKKLKVCIVGAESWGSAITTAVGINVLKSPIFDKRVHIYVYDELIKNHTLSEIINDTHENIKYLPGIHLPENLIAVNDLLEAAQNADIIIFATPQRFIKSYCNILSGKVKSNAIAVSLIKGLVQIKDGETGLFSHIISKQLEIPCYSLISANSAMEMAQGKLCEITIGCNNEHHSELLIKIFQTENCKVVTINDVEGVELCGALKDIVALGAGIIDGLRLGENTRVAVLHLGLKEMMRFVKNFYPTTKLSTFFESCGVADLVAACYADKNVQFAKTFVNSGKTIQELEENITNGKKLLGPLTAEEVNNFLSKENKENQFPLFTVIHKICQNEVPPEAIVEALRNHPDLQNLTISELLNNEHENIDDENSKQIVIADTKNNTSVDHEANIYALKKHDDNNISVDQITLQEQVNEVNIYEEESTEYPEQIEITNKNIHTDSKEVIKPSFQEESTEYLEQIEITNKHTYTDAKEIIKSSLQEEIAEYPEQIEITNKHTDTDAKEVIKPTFQEESAEYSEQIEITSKHTHTDAKEVIKPSFQSNNTTEWIPLNNENEISKEKIQTSVIATLSENKSKKSEDEIRDTIPKNITVILKDVPIFKGAIMEIASNNTSSKDNSQEYIDDWMADNVWREETYINKNFKSSESDAEQVLYDDENLDNDRPMGNKLEDLVATHTDDNAELPSEFHSLNVTPINTKKELKPEEELGSNAGNDSGGRNETNMNIARVLVDFKFDKNIKKIPVLLKNPVALEREGNKMGEMEETNSFLNTFKSDSINKTSRSDDKGNVVPMENNYKSERPNDMNDKSGSINKTTRSDDKAKVIPMEKTLRNERSNDVNDKIDADNGVNFSEEKQQQQLNNINKFESELKFKRYTENLDSEWDWLRLSNKADERKVVLQDDVTNELFKDDPTMISEYKKKNEKFESDKLAAFLKNAKNAAEYIENAYMRSSDNSSILKAANMKAIQASLEAAKLKIREMEDNKDNIPISKEDTKTARKSNRIPNVNNAREITKTLQKLMQNKKEFRRAKEKTENIDYRGDTPYNDEPSKLQYLETSDDSFDITDEKFDKKHYLMKNSFNPPINPRMKRPRPPFDGSYHEYHSITCRMPRRIADRESASRNVHLNRTKLSPILNTKPFLNLLRLSKAVKILCVLHVGMFAIMKK